ncbi:MAG: cell division ATP-binding protein FtsE [Cyanobacteria bacterium J06598_3]
MISILPRKAKAKQPSPADSFVIPQGTPQGMPQGTAQPTALKTPAPAPLPREAALQPNRVVTTQPNHTENLDQAASQGQPEASAPPIITIDRVSKAYPNGSPALQDINLSLNKGDFLFITGPSGAGKSTLLKLLYGQEKATQGSVCINGQDITHLKGNQLALLRRRIGVVFQDYKLIASRTVAENVAFVLHAQGYSRKEIERRLPVTLKMVGLQDKAERFPSQLSGGEQQRASIARAIVGTPPLLLADEPTGNLDGDNARQVINILRKLNGIGITVVVTTHDEQIVRQLSYPVVQIRNHRLYHFR